FLLPGPHCRRLPMLSVKSYKLLTSVLFAFFTSVSPLALAQTFNVLYTFHGPNGGFPETQLTLDSAGNIYGTTTEGGKGSCGGPGCGTVFEISKSGKLMGS